MSKTIDKIARQLISDCGEDINTHFLELVTKGLLEVKQNCGLTLEQLNEWCREDTTRASDVCCGTCAKTPMNPKKTKDDIVQWIRRYFAENGAGCSAVVGISGGKDSSIVAALCIEALGKDRIVGVTMPNGIQHDMGDSVKLINHLGITALEVNIKEAVDALESIIGGNVALFIKNGHGQLSTNARINLPPRIRMATLYAVAQTIPGGGRIANTCNLSEDYVGYSTKFGDAAGDFSPLANLLVSEVKQIGHALNLPADLVDKVPADGLCGATDEDNLGFTYETLDAYIEDGTCENDAVRDKIDRLHRLNQHKYNPMPSFHAFWR